MNKENPYLAPQTSAVPATDDIAKQMAGLQWPLKLSFKILALASQATVTDANGRIVCFTRQKMFKFREHVEIFTNKSKATLLADIKTQKVIDWSARYFSTNAQGTEIGSVGRRGWKSIFRAHYDVFNPGDDTSDYTIREENPVSKFFDGLLGGIPILGFLMGYLFHPRYGATKSDGQVAMRLTKQPAFLEGKFAIEKLDDSLTPHQEMNLVLSFMMMILLERRRG